MQKIMVFRSMTDDVKLANYACQLTHVITQTYNVFCTKYSECEVNKKMQCITNLVKHKSKDDV